MLLEEINIESGRGLDVLLEEIEIDGGREGEELDVLLEEGDRYRRWAERGKGWMCCLRKSI